MLTRSQVAKRLGKSVATVRRIEGVLLAPTRDRRGVYRFNVDDVDDLARDIARGDVSIWQEMNDAADPSQSRLCNASEPASLRNDLDSDRALAQAQFKNNADQLAKLEYEHRELLTFTQQLAKLFMESSSANQLDVLPEVVLATLIALSDD